MRTLIVGGSPSRQKTSSIVAKLAKEFPDSIECNGYWARDISCYDLTIWMPDISNKRKKEYPQKDKGSVLILSKVMREGYTKADAVKRIFAAHGNAVICIYKHDPKAYEFELVDALGNTWESRTSSLFILANIIKKFYEWTKSQIRFGFAPLPEDQYFDDYLDVRLPKKLVYLNTVIADQVESGFKERYFGNFSTRCMKLFPSVRSNDTILVSPRNIDKRRITEKDCILVMPPYYLDPTEQDRKYSVDTPVQISLYQQFPEIKYMIHGHAYVAVKSGNSLWQYNKTKKYYPCGDLREVSEAAKLLKEGHRAINLKKHGFLLTATSLLELETLIANTEFVIR